MAGSRPRPRPARTCNGSTRAPARSGGRASSWRCRSAPYWHASSRGQRRNDPTTCSATSSAALGRRPRVSSEPNSSWGRAASSYDASGADTACLPLAWCSASSYQRPLRTKNRGRPGFPDRPRRSSLANWWARLGPHCVVDFRAPRRPTRHRHRRFECGFRSHRARRVRARSARAAMAGLFASASFDRGVDGALMASRPGQFSLPRLRPRTQTPRACAGGAGPPPPMSDTARHRDRTPASEIHASAASFIGRPGPLRRQLVLGAAGGRPAVP